MPDLFPLPPTSFSLSLCQNSSPFACAFSHPRTMCLALNYIVKFISHRPFFKDVYREAGILCLITNALKTYYNELKLEAEQNDGKVNAGQNPTNHNVYLCASG